MNIFIREQVKEEERIYAISQSSNILLQLLRKSYIRSMIIRHTYLITNTCPLITQRVNNSFKNVDTPIRRKPRYVNEHKHRPSYVRKKTKSSQCKIYFVLKLQQACNSHATRKKSKYKESKKSKLSSRALSTQRQTKYTKVSEPCK